MKHLTIFLLTIGLLIITMGCGQSDQQETSGRASGSSATELSAFELEHGIGPVTERIEIGDFNPALAEKGQTIFNMKCAACHQQERRFVGPAYADVLDRRSPEFVMNIILNPGEMIRRHPEGQKMLAEYMTAMPFQNVSKDEARAIVEYLRTYQD